MPSCVSCSLQVQSLDETLQNTNLQMSRLKSDLRVTQQEKETLKQEVMSLHEQLQNANEKVTDFRCLKVSQLCMPGVTDTSRCSSVACRCSQLISLRWLVHWKDTNGAADLSK